MVSATFRANDAYSAYIDMGAPKTLTFPEARNDKAQSEDWAKCLNSLGWLMGLEPTTTGITILDSTN